MKESQLIEAYIEYLKQICGFAQRTIKFHQRICGLWQNFMRIQKHQEALGSGHSNILKNK